MCDAAAAVRLDFHEYGDAAILADVVGGDYTRRWLLTRSLGAALSAGPHRGIVDAVASYQHVFVSFDPLITDHDAVCAQLIDLLAEQDRSLEPRRFVVPVVFGADFGPDLAVVAQLLGTTQEEIIHRQLCADWTVRFVGSPLGAPMMDGPTMPGSVPRLPEPRTRVEPGSLALSGFQSIIYNAPSPGGWQVIGRTPLRLFNLDNTPHVPYRAGDLIRFRRISPEEWNDWDGAGDTDELVGCHQR
jgi:KipI family sensor histidine kinase inhibitor